MSTSENLFELIKSLTPPEKRYFKVFAQRYIKGTENNYVQLFNAISKQKIYDETKLLKKIKNDRFVRHFSSEKNYLYKLLLKALNAYQSEHNVKIQIRSQLDSINLLFDKRLIQQGFQQLKKTKKMALKYEAYLALFKILDLEINFAHQFPKEKTQEIRKRNFKEKKDLLQLLRHSDEYREIYFQIMGFSRKKMTIVQSTQKTQLKQLLQSPILQKNLYPNSLTISHLYYSILKIGNDLLGNKVEAYQNAQALLNSWEQHPQLQSENKPVYLITLQNHLVSCYLSQQWTAFKETIAKIRAIPTRSVNEAISAFEITYNAESVYLSEQNDFEGIHELHQEVAIKLKEYRKHLKVNALQLWYFNFAQFDFFVRNQNKTALDHLQDYFSLVANAKKTGRLRLDIHRKAQVLELLVHLELNNSLYLTSLLRNTKRYFQMTFDSYPFEKRIFLLVKELIDLPPQIPLYKTAILYKDCLLHLQKLKDEKEIKPFAYVLIWLESKVKGIPVQNILKHQKQTCNS
ncbi:MAG: hypothetical protein ACPG49_08450 [Chitinophagales bacterium]